MTDHNATTAEWLECPECGCPALESTYYDAVEGYWTFGMDDPCDCERCGERLRVSEYNGRAVLVERGEDC